MKYKNILLIAVILIGFMGTAQSQNKKNMYYTNDQNVAIGGYDLVAYFNQNSAVRGSQEFSAKHNEVEFYFSSAANQKAFNEAPEKYLPQYGGWCAFAMGAQNAKVPSNPRTFKLYNGKLFLFFNDYYQGAPFNTIVPWNADEAGLKSKADENWKGLK